MRPLRFAHISDTHLVCAGSSEWMFQVQREVRDPRRNLERCLEQVAQWQPDVVLLTGDIMTMPGLPKQPAACKIDVDEQGSIRGLF